MKINKITFGQTLFWKQKIFDRNYLRLFYFPSSRNVFVAGFLKGEPHFENRRAVAGKWGGVGWGGGPYVCLALFLNDQTPQHLLLLILLLGETPMRVMLTSPTKLYGTSSGINFIFIPLGDEFRK